MSGRQAKRSRRVMRREVRAVLKERGALPEQVLVRKPRWVTTTMWARLYYWLMYGEWRWRMR